jgi:uncharacterized membrane protein YagU involved in acid resistance
MTPREGLNRVVVGAVAGLLATAAMTTAMRLLHRRLPAPERYPLPPREIVERVIPDACGRGPSETVRRDATLLVHFGYGAATGALYAAAGGSRSLLAGAAYGVAVWAASYLGHLPALGILEPAVRHPPRRNALMIAVHLVWGATLAANLRDLEAAEREIFSSGPCHDHAASRGP